MFQTYPSPGRVTLGLIVAALAAAAPTIILGPIAVFVLPFSLAVALAHAFILGLPAYLVLRRRRPLDYGVSTIAGFVIGFVPVLVLVTLISMPNSGSFTGETSTAAWFREIIGLPIIFGLLGSMGGLVFRRVVGADEGLQIDPRIFD